MGNLLAGIDRQQQISGKPKVMIASTDLPFLTRRSLDWVAENAYVKRGLGIPIVTQTTLEKLSPTFETYYWPMSEGAFKWVENVTMIDVNLLQDERISRMVEKNRVYRARGSYNVMNQLKRIGMILHHGGIEAIYTVLLNYISGVLQIKFNKQNPVPFSQFRRKQDYEGLLSRTLGFPVKMIEMPYVDTCLDVDDRNRLTLFSRGYEKIKSIVSR